MFMVTRNDVAKLAKVSPAVVSYVLNASNYVSKEKRDAVLAAVEELHYIPNQTAKYLKLKKTQQIAVLCGSQLNDMFNDLLLNMESMAYEKGYLLSKITVIIDENNYAKQEFIDAMISRRFDAIFVANSSLTEKQINQLISHGIEVLLYVTRDYSGLDDRVGCIIPDYRNGVKNLVEILIDAGHRRIAFVPNLHYPSVWRNSNHRFDGYLQALSAHGLTADPQYIVTTNNTVEETLSLVDRMFDKNYVAQPPTAICTDESLLAGKIMNHLKQKGYHIPHDISVVASSDSTLASMTSPEITTCGFAPLSFASEAIDMLLKLLEGETVDTRLVELSLFKRKSIAKCSQE